MKRFFIFIGKLCWWGTCGSFLWWAILSKPTPPTEVTISTPAIPEPSISPTETANTPVVIESVAPSDADFDVGLQQYLRYPCYSKSYEHYLICTPEEQEKFERDKNHARLYARAQICAKQAKDEVEQHQCYDRANRQILTNEGINIDGVCRGHPENSFCQY